MEIEVVRSTRRRKTVQARLCGDVLRVMIPATTSRAQEAAYVERMRARFERRETAAAIDLAARARELAERYGLPVPAQARWVPNQHTRWGSCTPANGSIRISDRIAGFPPWVVDAVVVHELAHLAHPDHGPGWRSLVERYPLTERATGFLIAVGLHGDTAPDRGSEPRTADDACDDGDRP